MAVLRPGDSFGSAALLEEGATRNASIVATGTCDLYVLTQSVSASPAVLTQTCGALGSIFLSKSDFLVLGLASRSIVYHPERCRELLQVGGASACRSASAVGSCRLTMCVCVWCVCRRKLAIAVTKTSFHWFSLLRLCRCSNS